MVRLYVWPIPLSLYIYLFPGPTDSYVLNRIQLIHSVGIESALADILTWSVVKRFHDDFSSPVREVTCCVSDQKYVEQMFLEFHTQQLIYYN